MKDVLGSHLKDPLFLLVHLVEYHPITAKDQSRIHRTFFPFGSLVEYHPITAKDQSRIHQFGEKVLLGLFLGNDGRARNHLRCLVEGNKRWKCNNQMVPLLTDTRGLLLRANTVARFIVMITAMWMEKCNDWFVTSIWHNVRLRQVGNRWL